MTTRVDMGDSYSAGLKHDKVVMKIFSCVFFQFRDKLMTQKIYLLESNYSIAA